MISKTENPYCSRNLGLSKANGKVIAFLDAKSIPQDNWLKNGITSIIDDEKKIAAGRYNVVAPSEKLIDQVYGLLYLNNQKNVVHKYGVTTGNLFVHRSAFMTNGFFCEDHISGNDIKWTKLAQKNGHEIIYNADALVSYYGQSYEELGQSIKKYFSGISYQENLEKKPICSKIMTLSAYMLPLRVSTFTEALVHRNLKDISWYGKCYLWMMTWRMKTKMAMIYLLNLLKQSYQ